MLAENNFAMTNLGNCVSCLNTGTTVRSMFSGRNRRFRNFPC